MQDGAAGMAAGGGGWGWGGVGLGLATGLAIAATAPYYRGYMATLRTTYAYGYGYPAYGYGYPYGYRRAYYRYGGYFRTSLLSPALLPLRLLIDSGILRRVPLDVRPQRPPHGGLCALRHDVHWTTVQSTANGLISDHLQSRTDGQGNDTDSHQNRSGHCDRCDFCRVHIGGAR